MQSVSTVATDGAGASFRVNNEPAVSLNETVRRHLASRPIRVPRTHGDRAVTVVTPHDASRCVNGPSFELQKTYRCASRDHHPVHPAGTWEGACDPASGAWQQPVPTVHLGAHGSQEVWLDELADWRALLDLLAGKPDAAIVLGRLRREYRRDASAWRWSLPDKRDRYEDHASRWFVVDLDHVPGEIEDADGTLADYISEVMPDLSGCAYVAAFTSSAGIKGTRVRLVFELDEPRTLAAMRAFALAINERAKCEVIDASVYGPGHLIITAAPRLFASVANGATVAYQHLPRPVRTAAWHVKGDLASIPQAAAPVTRVTGAHVPTGVRSEALTKAAAAELLQALAPGNYSTLVHRWLCHVAWATPEHCAEAAFNEAVSAIEDRIRETSEPARLDERLRIHGNARSLRRAWDAALERKAKQLTDRPLIGSVTAPAATAALPVSLSALGVNTAYAIHLSAAPAASNTQVLPPTIDNVRAQLKADLVTEADAITRGAKRHVLFTHAPGAGKTTGLLSVLTAGQLSSHLTRIATPTHALADELVAAIKAHAATLGANGNYFGIDLVASVRHHKGRAQLGMCPDAVSRPKADVAESLGASVRKHACSGCDTGKAGKCPWLAQADDDANGVIVEVHHAANAPAERRADLMINDEGTIAATIQTGGDSIAIGDLAKAATVYAVKADYVLGARLARETIELNGYRSELRRALNASVPAKEGQAGRLLTAAIPSLVAEVTFEAREGMRREQRVGTGAAHAAELEAQLQATLYARIANDKTGADKRADAVAQLRASQAATRLYEAVDASAQRQYVFGVASYYQGRGKARVDRVKCFTRSNRPAREASISFDGTADANVWRALVSPTGAAFNESVFGATPEIAPGAMTVYQYADKAGALSSLVNDGAPCADEVEAVERREWLTALAPNIAAAAFENPSEQFAAAETAVAAHALKRETRKKRADSHLEMLWRFVLTEAASHSGRAVAASDGRQLSTLLIAQKAVLERLRGMGLPSTVAAVHFGSLRGLNGFKDVPCCIVIGRPRPSDIDLELQTEALHSHNAAVMEICRRQTGQWSEAHPDPRVAAVQQVTAAAEVKQAVARIRPYDRTPAKPCTVHVFGVYDTGLPSELVQLKAWSDAERSPAEVALAYGAVFSDARLNRKAYGSLFPRGNADGDGRVDRELRSKFLELVGNLARQVESRLKPYKESREGGSTSSLLKIETGFADALAYPGVKPSRRHRLVRLRTPASRKASFALIDARWSKPEVERRLRCGVSAWVELTVEGVLATNAGHTAARFTAAVAAT